MTNASIDFRVDTNIFVYVYDPSDTTKQGRAIAVTTRLARSGTGAVSTQVLGEIFITATRKLPTPLTHAEATDAIGEIARYWTVLDVTAEAVFEAVRAVQQHQLPYWDALIWSVAKLNGIMTVLSEDFSDGRVVEGVRFVNPVRADFDLASL